MNQDISVFYMKIYDVFLDSEFKIRLETSTHFTFVCLINSCGLIPLKYTLDRLNNLIVLPRGPQTNTTWLGNGYLESLWHYHCGFSDTDNQRVIIHVKDVNDEPPYFINRPLPMQTVVQLNAAPNTPVFTLQARDPDTDHNIHYFIVRDRTGGRFEVDERSGVVRTRGTDPFQLDMEYVLYVKAEDQVSAYTFQIVN